MKTETTKTMDYIYPKVRVTSLRSRTVLCQSGSGLQNYDVDDEEEIE